MFSHNKRNLVVLAIIVFILFSTLIIQFYKIQIIDGEKWTQTARRQHFFLVNEPPMRGVFYSNTSVKQKHPQSPQPFVFDIQKFHLYVDPESVPVRNREEIAKQLHRLIGQASEGFEFLKSQFEKKSRSRKLAMWLDQTTQDRILDWWSPYAKQNKIPRNAIFFVTDYQRSYPFGKLLGQVLHTVQNQKEEATKQAIPTGGLELWFQNYLQGGTGVRRLMRSPRHSFETGEVIKAPKHGADIYLTVNHCLQAIAEEEIAKAVEKHKAKSGWAVMLEPRTGEILALAQYPHFSPTHYQKYFNDPVLIEYTRVKAITDAQEPGSVMKPFTLACALLANEELKKQGKSALFDPLAMMQTSNGCFPGRRNLSDTTLHHHLNMYMAFQKSSNIYMARLTEKIVNQLGNDWYRRMLNDRFGFGKKTGVELPAESAGVLPTPGKKHPNGALEWSVPTPFSLAIGHNIQTTSLQLARAYAIFANGGFLVQPTLIKKIVRKEANGKEIVLLDNTTEARRKAFPRVMSAEMVDDLVKAMKYTTKPGGTARRADVRGYTEAGKTGTANKIVHGSYSPTQYCSTFVGFVPAHQAAFVLLVTMDEPEFGFVAGIGKIHHGGTCCAPVFREIARRSLEYMGIPQDDPHGFPAGDPRYDPAKADWLPEIQRLQEMYEKWNNRKNN